MPAAKKKSSFKVNESVVSVILGALVVLVVGTLIYRYFSNINRQRKSKLTNQELIKKESQITPAPSKPEEETGNNFPKKYQVVAGDCLWTIAEKYYQNGFNWVTIAKENKLENPDLIFPNQELVLPELKVTGDIAKDGASTIGNEAITSRTYKIVAGDNLWNIAIRACGDGFKWLKISQKNQLVNPDLIEPGKSLKISCQ